MRQDKLYVSTGDKDCNSVFRKQISFRKLKQSIQKKNPEKQNKTKKHPPKKPHQNKRKTNISCKE